MQIFKNLRKFGGLRLEDFGQLLKSRHGRKFFGFAISYIFFGQKRQKETLRFTKYRIETTDLLSFIWQFKENFVDENLQFKTTSNSPVVIDCGSNIGTTCLYFKSAYPLATVVAYEPNPKIYELLKRNLNNNGFDDVQILNKALWSDDKDITFSVDDADASNIFSKQNQITVQAAKLSTTMQKFDRIDMLKIDIEGAETEVLRECEYELSRVNNMFIEYHEMSNNQNSLEELLAILTRSGFHFCVQSEHYLKQPLLKSPMNSPIKWLINIFAYRTEQ